MVLRHVTYMLHRLALPEPRGLGMPGVRARMLGSRAYAAGV